MGFTANRKIYQFKYYTKQKLCIKMALIRESRLQIIHQIWCYMLENAQQLYLNNVKKNNWNNYLKIAKYSFWKTLYSKHWLIWVNYSLTTIDEHIMSLLNATNLLHVRVALIYFTRVPDYKRFQLEFILIPEKTANQNTASNKYIILILERMRKLYRNCKKLSFDLMSTFLYIFV